MFMWIAIGSVLGWFVYGVITTTLEFFSRRWCYASDEQKKAPYRKIWFLSVLICVIVSGMFGPPLEREIVERAKAQDAAYEASLKHVTVIVTDVEPVPSADSINLIRGSMILTEEFPRQKLVIPAHKLRKVSVGDMLELKLDGWNVVEAAQAETMPIPHAK